MTSPARLQKPADLPLRFPQPPPFAEGPRKIEPDQFRDLMAQEHGGLLAMLVAKLCTDDAQIDPDRVREALHHVIERMLRMSRAGRLWLDLATWKAYVYKSARRAYFHREKRDSRLRQHDEIEWSEGERQDVGPEAPDAPISAEMVLNEDLALQAKYVTELPETLRAVIELRLKDLSHKEIAERLGISETAARQRYVAALAKLAKKFGIPKKTAHTRRSQR